MGIRAAGTPAPFGITRLLALLAALSLVATACGGGGDDEGGEVGTPTTEVREEGEPQQGGSIEIGLEAETQNWAPTTGNWASSGYNVAFAIFDPLMARTDDGDIAGYLAESLEPNDDLTQWTLTLRPGVTFHDGTPLNAEAVAYNLEQGKATASNLAGVLEDVERFEVTGELTGVYHLTATNAAFPDLLTQASGVMVSPTAHAADPDAFANNPVGTGPFTFVSWQRDNSLVVERNDDYWQEGQPYLDRITFRPIPDEETRYQSLLSDDVQAMQSLRQSIVRQALEADDAGELEANVFTGNNTGSAIFNTLVPPVDDVRVRRALAFALDQEILIEVLGGEGISPEMTQYHSPDSPWFSEEVADAWPTNDLEAGQALIEEYVNDPARSDGKAAGEPVSIDFNCPPDASLIELSQVYQELWQELGPVEVNIDQVEQQAHVASAIGSASTNPPFAGDYMVNCFRVGAQTDPYITFDAAFGDPNTTATNFTNYTSPALEENLVTLRSSADRDERFAAVEAIGLDLAENVPNTFTGATATMIASVNELNGITGWTLPDGAVGEGIPDAYTRWGQVWLGE